jgi:hypothetical protein
MLAALAAGIVVALLLAFTAVKLDPHPLYDAQREIQLTPGLVVGQVLTYLPLVAAVLPLLPFVAMRSYRELGLHGIRFRNFGVAALGAAAMFVATGLGAALQNALLHTSGKQMAVALFGTTHDPVLLIGLAVIAVFFAPFTEELIFRGFVFNALLRYLPAAAAIALDGFLFGLSHLDAAASFPLMLGGAVLAYVYWRTGSLVTSMLTHGTFNFVSVVAVLAVGDKLT